MEYTELSYCKQRTEKWQLFEKNSTFEPFDWQTKSRRGEKEEKEEATLHCVVCSHLITPEKERTTVSGRHLYTFTNPNNIEYRIGCFKQSTGCLSEGDPSPFWTWFPGYSWQIQRCGRCLFHMGWRYDGEAGSFYGLILKHLVSRSGLA